MLVEYYKAHMFLCRVRKTDLLHPFITVLPTSEASLGRNVYGAPWLISSFCMPRTIGRGTCITNNPSLNLGNAIRRMVYVIDQH